MSTIKTNAITTVAGKPILNSTGSILQVVQEITTASISTSSGSATASGFIASITPSSASSKILVSLQGGGTNYGSTRVDLPVWIYRSTGGAYSSIGPSYFNRQQQGSTYNVPTCIQYLDSPATTSTVSYQPYFSQTTSNVGYLNLTPTALVFILMEVSA